ncbi:MAG: cell division protein ZipA C-terminal FtsZ-binding domain-containing protein [Fimbriimonas sp.]
MSTPIDPTTALFGGPLATDPAVALAPLDLVLPIKGGPLHRVQFVIELVGPRSVPAASAMHLLSPQWYGALGQPQIFVMRASDLSWNPMQPTPDGSYDSIALAWDLITPQGNISPGAAKNLLKVAEDFGPYISRRAVPMPPPQDVGGVVRGLTATRDALDVGFALSVVSERGGFAERDLWIECARLGLEFHDGGFHWRSGAHPHPLVTVTPFGVTDAFSLGNVQAGAVHPGVTVGFHLPISVAPTQGLEGCFRIGAHLAGMLGGVILDENDTLLTDATRQSLREELRSALSLFAKAGITTGSPEALRLFGVG